MEDDVSVRRQRRRQGRLTVIPHVQVQIFSDRSNQLRSLAKAVENIWDASGLGVFLPRLAAFCIPSSAQLSLLSEDWLNINAYKERNLDYSLRILSSGNHGLSHKLNWLSLPPVEEIPGHRLTLALNYSYKIYPRDPPLKPTGGFEFLSTTDIRNVSITPLVLHNYCSIRQDVGIKHTIPLGFCGADLKPRASAGVLHRLSSYHFRGFRDLAEPRRLLRQIMGSGVWDLAVEASADLSFDLPFKVLRDAGIRGYVSVSTSGVNNGFSLQELNDYLQHDVGVGVIIPTRLFRMVVNCCHALQGPNQGTTGIEFSFSRK